MYASRQPDELDHHCMASLQWLQQMLAFNVAQQWAPVLVSSPWHVGCCANSLCTVESCGVSLCWVGLGSMCWVVAGSGQGWYVL